MKNEQTKDTIMLLLVEFIYTSLAHKRTKEQKKTKILGTHIKIKRKFSTDTNVRVRKKIYIVIQ